MPTGRRQGYAARRGMRSFLSTNPTEAFKDPKLQALLGNLKIASPEEVRNALNGWDTRQTTYRALMPGHSTHHLGSMSAEGGEYLRLANDDALYGFHNRMYDAFGYSTGSEDRALRSQNNFAHTGANPGGAPGASSVSSHRSNKNKKRVGTASPTVTGQELFDTYKPVAQQNLLDYNIAQSTPPAKADTDIINKAGRELGIKDVVSNQGSLSTSQIQKVNNHLSNIGATTADGGKWWNNLPPNLRKALIAGKVGMTLAGIDAILDAGDLYAGTKDLTTKQQTTTQKKDSLVKAAGGAAGLATLAAPALAPVAIGLGGGQLLTEAARHNRTPKPTTPDSTYQHTPEKPVSIQPYTPYQKPTPTYQSNRQKLNAQRRRRRNK